MFKIKRMNQLLVKSSRARSRNQTLEFQVAMMTLMNTRTWSKSNQSCCVNDKLTVVFDLCTRFAHRSNLKDFELAEGTKGNQDMLLCVPEAVVVAPCGVAAAVTGTVVHLV